MPEFDGGNIDCHRHGWQAGIQPGQSLPAGFAQHPATNRHDEAGIFRDRHELPGTDQTVFRVLPADQRLGADHCAGNQVDLRLVIQQKLVLPEGAPQTAFYRQSPHRTGVHVGAEELVFVAAVGLGVKHRGVRVLHHAVHVVAVIRIDADADAEADMQFVSFDQMWQCEGGKQFFRDVGCIQRLFDFGQQNHEFVAALAAYRVGGAHARDQTLGDRLQQLIADGMSKRIVDAFEEIEIKEQQANLLSVSVGLAYRLRTAFRQQHPIRQTGEKVVLRQMRHAQRHGARFADIVEHQHGADDAAFPVVDRRGGILDGGLEAVAADQHAVDRQSYGLVFLDGKLRRVWCGFAGLAVNDPEYLGQRSPHCGFTRPAGHRFRDQIQVGHVAGEVGGQHGIANRVEGDLGTLLFLEQGFFRCTQNGLRDFPFADVLNGLHQAERLPAAVMIVTHGGAVDTHPDHAVAFLLEAIFGLKRLQAARRNAPLGEDAFAIFRVDRHAPVGAQRLFQLQPGDLVIRLIGVDTTAQRIGNENTQRRAIADCPEARLAVAQRCPCRLALNDITQCTRQPVRVDMRFGEIVVRAELHGLMHDFFIARAAQHQDQRFRRRLDQLIEGGNALTIGQGQIEQDDLDFLLPQAFERIDK